MLSEALDLLRANGLDYLEPDIVAELCLCLLQSDRPDRALAVVDDYLALPGDRPSADPETYVTLAATVAVAAFRVGDHVRARAACLDFAARRRSVGSPVLHAGGWTSWILDIQADVSDTARALGLDLDLPV